MKRIYTVATAGLLMLFASCKKEQTDPPGPAFYTVSEQTGPQTGLTLTLLADSTAFATGYNKVYFNVAGNPSNASVEVFAKRENGAEITPTETPVWNNTTGRYEGAAVFTTSSDSGQWELIAVLSYNNLADTLVFPVNVYAAPAGIKPVAVETGTDGNRYTVALVNPQAPIIGPNRLELAVFVQNGNNYATAENLAIAITPQMLSMGHSSPNNVNPVFDASSGHYTGQVNFTMSGDWRLFLQLQSGGADLVQNAFLDFNF